MNKNTTRDDLFVLISFYFESSYCVTCQAKLEYTLHASLISDHIERI